MLQTGESPVHEHITPRMNGHTDWVFSYHRRSEISWAWGHFVPHGRYDLLPYYLPLDTPVGKKYAEILRTKDSKLTTDYRKLLVNRTKQTLWMVSNCGVKDRLNYARELATLGVKLTHYGPCGNAGRCPRNSDCEKNAYVTYKFYLAFENSHCEDYVTEKLWKCLQHGMLPIVMGPSVQNVAQLLPPDSFLHVQNFSSPKALADYIQYLDTHNEAYLRYHAWRKTYEVVDGMKCQFLWACDMCKKMHDPKKPPYRDLSQWWTPKRQCGR